MLGILNLDHIKENAATGEIKISLDTIDRLDQLINDDLVKGKRYRLMTDE